MDAVIAMDKVEGSSTQEYTSPTATPVTSVAVDTTTGVSTTSASVMTDLADLADLVLMWQMMFVLCRSRCVNLLCLRLCLHRPTTFSAKVKMKNVE